MNTKFRVYGKRVFKPAQELKEGNYDAIEVREDGLAVRTIKLIPCYRRVVLNGVNSDTIAAKLKNGYWWYDGEVLMMKGYHYQEVAHDWFEVSNLFVGIDQMKDGIMKYENGNLTRIHKDELKVAKKLLRGRDIVYVK